MAKKKIPSGRPNEKWGLKKYILMKLWTTMNIVFHNSNGKHGKGFCFFKLSQFKQWKSYVKINFDYYKKQVTCTIGLDYK